jgi:hypothetical protein
MKGFVALTLVLFVTAVAPAGDYGDPLPLDKRVAELERKVAELEARLAAVAPAPTPVQQPVAPPTFLPVSYQPVQQFQTCVGGNCSAVQYAQPVRIFRR